MLVNTTQRLQPHTIPVFCMLVLKIKVSSFQLPTTEEPSILRKL